MRWYAPRLVYVWIDINENLDSNLLICETTSGDVPAPGDGGGLWYCGTQTESCADAITTFGIQQGYFADFRNFSTTSSAAATPTKSIAAISRAGITNDAGSNASAATGIPHTIEPSCPSHAGGDNTLSGGTIAGIAIGSFCAGLIAFGIIILVFRRRRGGKHQAGQTAIEGKDNTQRYWDRGPETVGRPSTEDPVCELPAQISCGVELQ